MELNKKTEIYIAIAGVIVSIIGIILYKRGQDSSNAATQAQTDAIAQEQALLSDYLDQLPNVGDSGSGSSGSSGNAPAATFDPTAGGLLDGTSNNQNPPTSSSPVATPGPVEVVSPPTLNTQSPPTPTPTPVSIGPVTGPVNTSLPASSNLADNPIVPAAPVQGTVIQNTYDPFSSLGQTSNPSSIQLSQGSNLADGPITQVAPVQGTVFNNPGPTSNTSLGQTSNPTSIQLSPQSNLAGAPAMSIRKPVTIVKTVVSGLVGR